MMSMTKKQYQEVLNQIETIKTELRQIEQDIVDDRRVDMSAYRSKLKELSVLRAHRDVYKPRKKRL
jgi:formiminotetrahydrofolate cyclodeaminase